jgi:hypothetical protein
LGQKQDTPCTPDNGVQVEKGSAQVDGPKQPQVAAPWQDVGITTQWDWLPLKSRMVTQAWSAPPQAAQLRTLWHCVTGTHPP